MIVFYENVTGSRIEQRASAEYTAQTNASYHEPNPSTALSLPWTNGVCFRLQ